MKIEQHKHNLLIFPRSVPATLTSDHMRFLMNIYQGEGSSTGK